MTDREIKVYDDLKCLILDFDQTPSTSNVTILENDLDDLLLNLIDYCKKETE